MNENIFDLLDDWDEATLYENKKWEREAGRKIEVLRKEYREKGNIVEKVKVVGFFSGDTCDIYFGDRLMSIMWNLKYTGRANEYDNTRLYENDDALVWLDYAVYE